MFDMAPQGLSDALRSIARQTGASMVIDARAVVGLCSGRVQGTLSALSAVRQALEGTQLIAVRVDGIIVVREVGR